MNIIYIHTHDSGRYLKPYGHNIPTPNLMNLASQSTLFRHCYCAAPTCSPSRAALLTGTSPHVNGMLGLAHRGFAMPDNSIHISEYLKNFGYETVLCGVQHEAESPEKLGYNLILTPAYPYDDIKNAEISAEYIKNSVNKPNDFFLSFGMFNTHREYNHDENIKQDYILPPPNMFDTPETRQDMANYHASAKIADDCVGIIIKALEESGIMDNSVVFFTTDHGIAFPHMKCSLYDTGIGVAFMIKYPGNPTCGTAKDSLISHIDVFPTLCDICGIDKPAWLSGKSFYDVLEGKTEEINDEIFAEVTYHAAYEPMRCIRTKRYKFIKRFDSYNKCVSTNIDDGASKNFLVDAGLLSRTVDDEMLFDLYFDPMERENLINDDSYTDIYNQLSVKLAKWMAQTNDPLLSYNRIPAPEKAIVNKQSSVYLSDNEYE